MGLLLQCQLGVFKLLSTTTFAQTLSAVLVSWSLSRRENITICLFVNIRKNIRAKMYYL